MKTKMAFPARFKLFPLYADFRKRPGKNSSGCVFHNCIGKTDLRLLFLQ